MYFSTKLSTFLVNPFSLKVEVYSDSKLVGLAKMIRGGLRVGRKLKNWLIGQIDRFHAAVFGLASFGVVIGDGCQKPDPFGKNAIW